LTERTPGVVALTVMRKLGKALCVFMAKALTSAFQVSSL
jgi:hypothetical protein